MTKQRRHIILTLALVVALCFTAVLACPCFNKVDAKTYKSLPKGGYYVQFKKAKIKKDYLILEGDVINWERVPDTKEYDKSGKYKLKLKRKCELLDGYKDSYTISKSKFNKLCKKKDSFHSSFAFIVKKKKVTMIRFW